MKRSTKQRVRNEAMKTALKWEEVARAGREKRLSESQARRVVSEILQSTTGETLNFHTCRAWLNEWLAGKCGVVAAKSIEKYEQVTEDFLEHLGERANLTLAAIGPKDVRSFRDALAKGGRSPGTVNQTIRKVLSAPFLSAMRLGYIPTNPCAAIEALRDDADSAREIFTAEQVGKLLGKAEGDWKGAILAGYFTGLRLRDVAELRWSAIDFKAGVLRIKTLKTGSALVVPLHEALTTWLHTQPRGIGQAPVFPSLAGKGTGGRHGLSGLFKAIMGQAEIKGRLTRGADGRGRKTSSLSFHSLRHSFVSALANAGVAAELRQKLSGHADDRTHARYTHHELESLRLAVAKLPSVSGAAS